MHRKELFIDLVIYQESEPMPVLSKYKQTYNNIKTYSWIVHFKVHSLQ